MHEYYKTHFGEHFRVIVMSNLCSVYISTWGDLVYGKILTACTMAFARFAGSPDCMQI